MGVIARYRDRLPVTDATPELTLGEGGTPRWNFHKYLIGPDGQLAGAWPTPVRPGDAKITAEIESALPKP